MSLHGGGWWWKLRFKYLWSTTKGREKNAANIFGTTWAPRHKNHDIRIFCVYIYIYVCVGGGMNNTTDVPSKDERLFPPDFYTIRSNGIARSFVPRCIPHKWLFTKKCVTQFGIYYILHRRVTWPYTGIGDRTLFSAARETRVYVRPYGIGSRARIITRRVPRNRARIEQKNHDNFFRSVEESGFGGFHSARERLCHRNSRASVVLCTERILLFRIIRNVNHENRRLLIVRATRRQFRNGFDGAP